MRLRVDAGLPVRRARDPRRSVGAGRAVTGATVLTSCGAILVLPDCGVSTARNTIGPEATVAAIDSIGMDLTEADYPKILGAYRPFLFA